MKRLAIITTHPIQYNAPLFKLLAERNKIAIKVFYTWGESVLQEKYDPGFKKNVEWDIPLLEGYEYSFVKNQAKKPGSSHFTGIDNPGLIKDIESWKAGAVLVFGWAFKSHLNVMRYFKGKIPVYFRGDSTLLDERGKGFKQKARQLFLKWVYSYINGAFYTGAHNRAYFEKMGLQPSQLFFAPHAIDNNRFNIPGKEPGRKNFRSSNSIPEDAFLFLFAGKLDQKKDPFLLGSAFEMMQQPGCHLLFAGTGSLEQELKDRFKDNTSVHFSGFQNQSQMPLLYNACDVFVLPSKGPGETWGLALNEAMASGKPVIASDRCGGAIDLINEAKNGYIFSAGSAEQLMEALKKIYRQKEHIEEMGNASLQIIQQFNFDNIANAIEKAISNHNS